VESILRFGAGVFGRLRNDPELPRSCFRPREGILKCDLDFDAPRNGMKPAQLRTLAAAAFGLARVKKSLRAGFNSCERWPITRRSPHARGATPASGCPGN